MNAASETHSRLAHFPVALFANVMGMAGLKAGQLGLVPGEIGAVLRGLAERERICVPE